MPRYEISNKTSGYSLGVYEGIDEHDALDALARDAGYAHYLASIKDTIDAVADERPDWDAEQVEYHAYWRERGDLVIAEMIE